MSHHLFFTSGKMSVSAKYDNAQAIIAIIINLFVSKNSLNGNRIIAPMIPPSAAIITKDSFL